MSESEFKVVAKTSDLADPGSCLVEVDQRLIVLVCSGGKFYALDDVCTHDGGPLSDGPVSGGAIACPRHGARFDLATGKALTMPATEPITAHEVRIEGEAVLIRLRDP